MGKILVIDDSPTFRAVITNLLEPLRYEIITASNGIEGIRQCVRHSPQLITVDLEMPVLNGASMMKILDMIGIDAPAIFITGSAASLKSILKLPFVTGAIDKKDIKQLLPNLAQSLIDNPRLRKFNDFDYELPHKEFMNFLTRRERKRILVIDDSKSMRTVMVRQLEKLKLFEVYQAQDGQEGLTKALMVKPDLVILDIEMSKLNGIRFAQILYILGHPFQIMFLSASMDEKVIRKAKSLEGVTHFFQKQEVAKGGAAFIKAIMKELQITDDKKAAIRSSYEKIDIAKIKDSGEFNLESDERY